MTAPIAVTGEEIGTLKAYMVARRGLGYVPENRDIFPSLTVRQNLLLDDLPEEIQAEIKGEG